VASIDSNEVENWPIEIRGSEEKAYSSIFSGEALKLNEGCQRNIEGYNVLVTLSLRNG